MARLFVPVVTLTLLTLAAAPAAEPLPAPQELHDLFEQKQFSPLLLKLQRVLLLKGEAAKPYDRHDLLRLKAETYLRLKMNAQALQALADAAGEVAGEPAVAAVDKATELLVRRSPTLRYQPRAKDKGKVADPVDVVEPDGRKRALVALFEDELATAEPRVKAVRDAKQLAPIVAVIPAIKDVRMLEQAATASDAKTKKLTGELAAHTRDLMADTLKAMTHTVDDVDKSASEYVQTQEIVRDTTGRGGVRAETRWKKRGLDRKDGQALRNVVGTCEQIVPASRDLAEALGADGAAFAAVRADAEALGRRADQLLNADYSRTLTRPPS